MDINIYPSLPQLRPLGPILITLSSLNDTMIAMRVLNDSRTWWAPNGLFTPAIWRWHDKIHDNYLCRGEYESVFESTMAQVYACPHNLDILLSYGCHTVKRNSGKVCLEDARQALIPRPRTLVSTCMRNICHGKRNCSEAAFVSFRLARTINEMVSCNFLGLPRSLFPFLAPSRQSFGQIFKPICRVLRIDFC